MNLTKEGWWELVKMESLSSFGDETLLAAFEQVFYSGYNCKEVEDSIVRSQLDMLQEVLK